MTQEKIEEIKRDYAIDLSNLPEEFVKTIDKLLEKIADLEEDVENLKCQLGYSGLPGNNQKSHYVPTLSDEVSSLRNDLDRLEDQIRWRMSND